MTPGRTADRIALIKNPQKPLFNRAISGAYSPGSTIKPFVAMAAMREGLVGPDDTVYSKGYIELPNPFVPDKPSRFLDWKAHGVVDMRSAIARSSNVYFYAIGGGFENIKGLGITKLRQYWDLFGFGKTTGIDAPQEDVGFLPGPEEKEARTHQPWRIGDTYNVSIGQGDLLVSPVQLLNAISSIAANGIMYSPSLVSRIEPMSRPGSATSTSPLIVHHDQLLDYSDWKAELEQAQLGMRDAVRKDYGTANLLSSLRFPTAGKTGSAQIQNNTKTNAFFVGYGPFENPSISILVLIENAKSGSLNAVPIARDVLEWYYTHRLTDGMN
jgi:penicillin-binding protein 2